MEHFIRHGNVLSHVTIATDPVYLTEPYIRSQEFVLMERNNTNWLYNCEYANEMPRDTNIVPMFLPGKNPWLAEIEAKYAMPHEAMRGGAATPRPSGSRARRRRRPGPAKNGGVRRRGRPATVPAGEVRAVHVQGNVHMIVGAGANVAVQVGEDGVRGGGHRGGRAGREGAGRDPAALDGKPIRWIINTTPTRITSAATSRFRSPAAP